MCVWYWLDRETALKVDQKVQKGLFLFASTNSCMNPIVYGLYNIPRRSRENDLVINKFYRQKNDNIFILILHVYSYFPFSETQMSFMHQYQNEVIQLIWHVATAWQIVYENPFALGQYENFKCNLVLILIAFFFVCVLQLWRII